MSAEYAAAIAPELDRIRIAMSRGATANMAVAAAEFGLTPTTGPVLGMLRNLAPDRRTTRDALAEVFLYQGSGFQQALVDLAAAGLVDASPDDVGLTPRGVQAVDALLAAMRFVTQSWDATPANFGELLTIAMKAIDAAEASAGLAFSVMAPMYAPADLPESLRLAESLTPLRFHRYDAHIAAWRAAGLTLEAVQALEDGPRKDAIEADTNERAGSPYAALSDAERTTLLDGLRSLPTPMVDP